MRISTSGLHLGEARRQAETVSREAVLAVTRQIVRVAGGVWLFSHRVWSVVSPRARTAAGRVRSFLWSIVAPSKQTRTERLEAARVAEEGKTVVLAAELKAKRELHEARNTNRKLRESIKKVGNRH